MNPIFLLQIYVCIMTVIGIAAMGIDKQKAKAGARRIPEKTLFLIALLGGSIGVLVGMYLFRHKTLHKSFTFGIPAIIVIQMIILVLIGWPLS